MMYTIFIFTIFLGLFYFVQVTISSIVALNEPCTEEDICKEMKMECTNSICRCKFVYKEIAGGCEIVTPYPKFTQMKLSNSDTTEIDIIRMWDLRGVTCGGDCGSAEFCRNSQKDSIDTRCIYEAKFHDENWNIEVKFKTENSRDSNLLCSVTHFSLSNTVYEIQCFTNKYEFQLVYTSQDQSKFYFGIYSPPGGNKTKLYIAETGSPMKNASEIYPGNGVQTLDSIIIDISVYDVPACQLTPSTSYSTCPAENGAPVMSNHEIKKEEKIWSSVPVECNYISMTTITKLEWWIHVDSESTNRKLTTINSAKYSVQTNDEANVYNSVLTVHNVSAADQGSYYCDVSNIFGNDISGNTTINLIKELPNPIVSPSEYSTTFGDSVTIICSIDVVYPEPKNVWWRKDNITLDMEDTNLHCGNSSDPSLTIFNTTFRNLGAYECCSSNSVGRGCSNQTLLGAAPVIKGIRQNSEAFLGKDVNLTCHVKSIPDVYEIIWLKQNKTFPGTYHVLGSVCPRQTQCSLEILSSRFSHAGTYLCNATNPIGSTQSDPYDLIIYGIKIHIQSDDNVIFGNTITLHCIIRSHPNVTDIQWFFNDTCVNQNIFANPMPYQLTITNANFANIGNYRCYAENGKVNETSDEKPLNVTGDVPVVDTYIMNGYNPVFISVNQSDRVTLKCNYAALPNATTLMWKRPDKSLPISNRATGGSLDSPNLNFVDIDTSDEGNYTCCVSNAVGDECGPSVYIQVNSTVPMCPCSCSFKAKLDFWKNKNFTKEEMLKYLEPLMKEVQKDMQLDKTKLSSTIRRKTSAPDNRKSAKQVGVVGIVFISVVVGLVIIIDLVALKRFVQHLRGNFNAA